MGEEAVRRHPRRSRSAWLTLPLVVCAACGVVTDIDGETNRPPTANDGGAEGSTREGGGVDGNTADDGGSDAAFNGKCAATGRPPHTIGVVKLGNGEVQLAADNNGLSTAKTFIPSAVPGSASPFGGQWSGTTGATVGYFQSTDISMHLFEQNDESSAEKVFYVGSPGDIGFAGDFDGDGTSTVGVYRPSAGEFQFFITVNPATGDTTPADTIVRFGDPGGLPVIGDWNCDGTDDFGVFYPSTGRFHLRLGAGVGQSIDFTVDKTGGNLYPLAGDWDGNGTATIGLFDNGTRKFYLALTNEAKTAWVGGVAGISYPSTSGDYRPVAARWKP